MHRSLTLPANLADRPAHSRALIIHRIERNVTAVQVAAVMGCTQSYVASIENGISQASAAQLTRIHEAIDTAADRSDR